MKERRYSVEPLPFTQDVERFAPPYSPENFTEEECQYLNPFFSNLDKPVFVIQHLPEEVIGALSSRYSRTTDGLRRVFLREYILPIVNPEQNKEEWGRLNSEQRLEALRTKAKFLDLLNFLSMHGGIDYVVNIQRGRKFFDKWLAEYGDDSISEMGGVHLAIEGLSNVAVKEIEDKRVGISPLEKSTRYVSFSDRRPDGNYLYAVPAEIIGTSLEGPYRLVADLLFETYSQISGPYLDYIKELYPRDENESESSFNNSRKAKRFDDLRDLLPFATQTNVALFGNGRAFEDLINRLMDHPLGEIRFWGQAICGELEKIVPSFVRRSKTQRGAEVQIYRTNLKKLREELSRRIFNGSKTSVRKGWAQLISFNAKADIDILSSFLFPSAGPLTLSEIRRQISEMPYSDREKMLQEILQERKFGKADARREEVRFRKVPRAFENAHYLFEVWARGGDYRDLHRHRQLTQERQTFGTERGYDLENEVLASPFKTQIVEAIETAGRFHKIMASGNPDVAQYIVPFAYIQHWYMSLSAREIYWMAELRTSPQGRPHYRKIVQEISRQAKVVSPSIFSDMMVDWGDYSISRRESEKKREKKQEAIE